MPGSEKSKILIVDDTPENIDVLVGALGSEYDLVAATDGLSAIDIVERTKPDIILLDVMMPGLSGYDVCRRLKSAQETADIPIIFLTALAADSNEQQGLELGAVDYISKPFNPSLVQTRISNHLSLEKARKELKKYGEKLEELVAQRTKELAEAHEQLKAIDETKNEFLAAISHELRTPANGILGIGSIAIDSLPPGEEKDDLLGDFEHSCQRLTDMLDSAMHLAKLQSGDTSLKLEPTALLSIITDAIQQISENQSEAQIAVSDTSPFSCQVPAEPTFLTQSLATLFQAAVKLNDGGNPVSVSGETRDDRIVIQISFKSQSVSEQLIKTMFKAFSPERCASYLEDMGLKLPVAERMIRAMFGRVAIESQGDSGFIIHISLPVI